MHLPHPQVTRLESPVEMEAKLVSFVLRFVCEESSDDPIAGPPPNGIASSGMCNRTPSYT